MKRKEAIIRYLALVGRAERHLITNYIIARLSSVSFKLTQLKHSGLVHNMKCSDGSKVWVLTPGATGDMIITSSEKESRKYKQRQKRSNGLYPLNYLKADLANTPKLTTSARAICLPLSEGALCLGKGLPNCGSHLGRI